MAQPGENLRPGVGLGARVRDPDPAAAVANPWNGKVVFQAFWWDLENQNYPQNWYLPRQAGAPPTRLGLMACGYRPPPKEASGGFSMGYDPFDHYDLGDKDQRGTLATKFGTKDELLRLIAVAHANGLDVYPTSCSTT